MTGKLDDSSNQGLFLQTPASPGEDHPANYISYISQRMRRYRQSCNADNRSEEGFGKNILSKYIGKIVSRSTVQRAEDGKIGTSWGIIAAYFYEMGVFPDIVRILEKGYTPTLRTAMLSKKKHKVEIDKAKNQAAEILNNRQKKEKEYGVLSK
jgi:hypothetical protein